MDNEKEITHIDLFSGIGAFTLAGEWAGFRTVAFCEKEEFCQKVLKKHWSEIPIIAEIRDFDGTKNQGATLLTGGFPCQPFSVAGQRRGKEDDRYLWPEMHRVINEAKPHWILAENVPGIFRMALDTVLADLEGEGYTTGTFIIPACGLNAPHRRNRVWIVAYYESQRYQHGKSTSFKKPIRQHSFQDFHAQNAIGTRTRNQDGKTDDQERQIGQDRREGIRQKNRTISTSRIASTNKYAPDSQCLGWQEGARDRIKHEEQISKGQDVGDGNSKGINSNTTRQFRGTEQRPHQSEGNAGRETIGDAWQIPWHEVATRFCRVDDGVPDRIHRLKALGNAIVPQIAYEILKRIAWIENERATD